MKKSYLIALCALFTGAAFAQTGLVQEKNKAELLRTYSIDKASSSERTFGTDTAGWSLTGNFLPEFAEPSGQATFYSYTGGGYVFGVNISGANLNECAQGYVNVNATPLAIREILIWFGAKEYVSNDPTSKTVVKIYTMAPNKARGNDGTGGLSATNNAIGPDQLLQSKDLLFTDIDTAALFTVVTLDSVVGTAADFVIAFNVADCKAKADTCGIVSDDDGDAQGQDYTFHRIGTAGWVVTNYAFGGLDINIAMFAVVDEATGVNEYYNGMKLINNYPNPAADYTTINYTLEEASKNVKIEVFSNNGQRITLVEEGFKAAGNYTTSLNLSNLSAGSYYYTLNANGHSLTKKLVVVK